MASPEPQAGFSDATGKAAPLGRRELKKQATRAAVREAALRLAARYGVENLTVDQIAAEADIGVRTFFNYFPTKEDALLASSAWGAQALVDAFRTRPASETVLEAISGSVLVVVTEGVGATAAHIEALRLIRSAPSLVPHQLAIMARHEAGLAEAIAERIGPAATGDGLYPQLCAAASIAALRVALDRWLVRRGGTGPADLDEFRAEFDRALDRLASGLDQPSAG